MSGDAYVVLFGALHINSLEFPDFSKLMLELVTIHWSKDQAMITLQSTIYLIMKGLVL